MLQPRRGQFGASVLCVGSVVACGAACAGDLATECGIACGHGCPLIWCQGVRALPSPGRCRPLRVEINRVGSATRACGQYGCHDSMSPAGGSRLGW